MVSITCQQGVIVIIQGVVNIYYEPDTLDPQVLPLRGSYLPLGNQQQVEQ